MIYSSRKWTFSGITAQNVGNQYVTLVVSRFCSIPVAQPRTFCSFGRGAIKGVQAAVLQSLQWDDNNSAFLITDLASQKKRREKNCKKMILLMRKVKQWLSKSLNGLYLKAGGGDSFEL